MIIENDKILFKKKSNFIVIGFFSLTLIASSLMTDYLSLSIFPFPGIYCAIFFLLVFVLILVYRNFLNFNYIYFSNETDKIILRYYPIKFFTKDFRSIEISKSSFRDFEEKKSFLGKKHDIILFQLTKKGIAKYPKISLSALNKKQKRDLTDTLTQLKEINSKKV